MLLALAFSEGASASKPASLDVLSTSDVLAMVLRGLLKAEGGGVTLPPTLDSRAAALAILMISVTRFVSLRAPRSMEDDGAAAAPSPPVDAGTRPPSDASSSEPPQPAERADAATGAAPLAHASVVTASSVETDAPRATRPTGPPHLVFPLASSVALAPQQAHRVVEVAEARAAHQPRRSRRIAVVEGEVSVHLHLSPLDTASPGFFTPPSPARYSHGPRRPQFCTHHLTPHPPPALAVHRPPLY